MNNSRVRKTAARALATAALSMTAVLGAFATAQAEDVSPDADAAGGTYAGCPYGAVCVYPGASWNGGNPSHVYWSYGGHNLYNQFGKHRVFNNQYGGAEASMCGGSGGTNCGYTLPEYTVADVNLTPVNSIKLSA